MVGKDVRSSRGESDCASSIINYLNRFADSLEDDFNPGVEIRDIVKENMILCVD